MWTAYVHPDSVVAIGRQNGKMLDYSVQGTLLLCEPAVPLEGVLLDPMLTSHFLGRKQLISSRTRGMARWREHLFAAMTRNALGVTPYLGLPPNRVVEIGAQVEI